MFWNCFSFCFIKLSAMCFAPPLIWKILTDTKSKRRRCENVSLSTDGFYRLNSPYDERLISNNSTDWVGRQWLHARWQRIHFWEVHLAKSSEHRGCWVNTVELRCPVRDTVSSVFIFKYVKRTHVRWCKVTHPLTQQINTPFNHTNQSYEARLRQRTTLSCSSKDFCGSFNVSVHWLAALMGQKNASSKPFDKMQLLSLCPAKLPVLVPVGC